MKPIAMPQPQQGMTLGQRILQATHLAVAMHLHGSIADRLISNSPSCERTTAPSDRWNRSRADHG